MVVVATAGIVSSPGAAAQPGTIALVLRPHAGDTVRTRFEQVVRFVGRDATGRDEPIAQLPTSGMTVFARSVVEQADAFGAIVVAITDSVVLDAPAASATAREQTRRAMQGRRSRLRVAPDGAMTVVGAEAGGPPAAMRLPGTLPPHAVAVASTWTRAMPLPWKAAADPRGRDAPPPRLDVRFRLDSLARNGMLAFVSMRGTVHAAGLRGDDPRAQGDGGSVAGALTVDRMRGWVVDSRTVFTLDGSVTLPSGPPGTAAATVPTTRPVRIVITQTLHAF